MALRRSLRSREVASCSRPPRARPESLLIGEIRALSGPRIKERLRRRYMRPGVRRVPIGIGAGLRMEVDPAAPVHIYLGTAEVEIARHLRRLATPGARCFDIGGAH